jgi:type IX secretion system PorP/SprF family membrane protein
LYRVQWLGFEGAPNSGFLSVSIPLNSKRKKFLSARHGTGFKFETDNIGNFGFNRLNMAYAAHFNFDKINRLSLGVYGGVIQTSFDPSTATTTNPDPAVLNQANFVAPDASFGAWFNSLNYYFGLSLKNLIPWQWPDPGYQSRHRFHSSFNAGYRFSLGEKISLLPVFIMRIPPRGPLSADLNLQIDYRNMISLGVGYRNTDALIFLVNFKIKEQFSIAYSYDYTLTDIQIPGNNTHELSLRFTTCKPYRPNTVGCTLFE